jgi:uncharacterized protein
MSAATWDQAVARIRDYIAHAALKDIAVIFHGGEPLLAGPETLSDMARTIRAAISCQIHFGLQTNGLLLNEDALKLLAAENIAVSLSLDGPKNVNDKHRFDHKGRSSFVAVEAALERLKAFPSIFSGVISVIDPYTRPRELLAYFAKHAPPKLDFLLPDANHLRPPPGRAQAPHLYKNWLIECFDVWIDDFPELPIRTFETLLDVASGLPSSTDAFGLGDVSLLSIETDGTYHDLDVLKITQDGATKLGGSVNDTQIATLAASQAIASHRAMLRQEGLCTQCQSCPIVAACGGGSLPHRFGPNGFDHPTVYCDEMLALIPHVKARLAALTRPALISLEDPLELPFSISDFENVDRSATPVDYLMRHHRAQSLSLLQKAMSAVEPRGSGAAVSTNDKWSEAKSLIASWPGALAWARTQLARSAGREIYAIDGQRLPDDTDYAAALLTDPMFGSPEIQIDSPDIWLRLPFGGTIEFETNDTVPGARTITKDALAIIGGWKPLLLNELLLTCRSIQFIRDPSANPAKLVSFSDNSVPGALYVSVTQPGRLVDPVDLADSLIHEYRHQKLYLLENLWPLVTSADERVRSPWREEPRPTSGLLHGAFVFVELRRFWAYIAESGPKHMRQRAKQQVLDTDRDLAAAFETLSNASLTPIGRSLLETLRLQGEPK